MKRVVDLIALSFITMAALRVFMMPLMSEAQSTSTCLTGTAPSVANDAAQITAVRGLIDAGCVCSSYDGSSGKTHKDYVKCAAAIIATQADAQALRPQCKTTVKKYYVNSTCGTNPQLHAEPCIQTSRKSGKITCAIKSRTKKDGVTPAKRVCTDTARVRRVPCPGYTSCIAAADTNHDLIIGAPGDTGGCGNVCPPGTVSVGGTCVCGGTVCGGICIDPNVDPNNCGSCGNACPAGDSCVGGTCVPPPVANACLPTAMLSVLVQPPNVTAYVPLGSWSESRSGVAVVPLEPTVGSPTVIPTGGPVNSCASNGTTGTTICTGNSNDVYVINGTTLSSTLTAGGTAPQSFSGGTCYTCGVAIDPTLGAGGAAVIMAGASVGGPGALQFLDINSGSFGTLKGLGAPTSEDISVDPVQHLVLSANESDQFQIFNEQTGQLFNSTNGPFGGDLDSTAEDCSTGIALAPAEFATSVTLWDLKQAVFTAGSPGTWSAPFKVQNFSDFSTFSAGTSGSAVAPESHLALIAGEFGGTAFGVIQLPFTSGSGTPAAVDVAGANLPNTPDGQVWAMGRDPHTVTAYVSPSTGRALGLMSNVQRTYLALIDLQALIGAPRTVGMHTVDPSVDLVSSGIVTYVAE